MRLLSRTKIILAMLTATCLLGLAVGSATAGRLSTSNTKYRLTWNAMRMTEVGGEGIQQTCRITLEGSFHSATVRKVVAALVGAVTRAIVDSTNCRGTNEPHRLTILQEVLPWHVTYEGFAGTLPNITSLQFLIRRYAWQISATLLGITARCLYLDGGLPEENLRGSATRNTVTGEITQDEQLAGRRSRFLTGAPFPELCPEFTALIGTGQLFLLGNTTRLTITLI